MRTTLTLDEDVAARLKAEARRSGLPFRTVVNEHLRLALAQQKARKTVAPFSVAARAMGGPKSAAGYDDVSALLEQSEGARHR